MLSVGYRIKGLLVLDAPGAMCCVIEQIALSSSKYWFNPGKGKCPNMTVNLLMGSKASIHIKKSFRIHIGKPIQVLGNNKTRK